MKRKNKTTKNRPKTQVRAFEFGSVVRVPLGQTLGQVTGFTGTVDSPVLIEKSYITASDETKPLIILKAPPSPTHPTYFTRPGLGTTSFPSAI